MKSKNRLSKRAAKKKFQKLFVSRMKERFRLSRAQRPIIFIGNQNCSVPSCFNLQPELQSHIEIKNREIFDVSDLVLPEIATFGAEKKRKRRRQTKQFDFKKSKRKKKQARKSRKINR